MRKYVKQLRNGCAPGVDGIVPEHLKLTLDSDMPLLNFYSYSSYSYTLVKFTAGYIKELRIFE